MPIYILYVHVSALWNEHMPRDLQLLTLIQKGKIYICRLRCTSRNWTVASQKNNLAHIMLTFNILKGKEIIFLNDSMTGPFIYIYTVYTSYLQLFLLLCSSCCFFGMSSWPLLVIRGEMGIHLQVKILRAIMGKYPQHWLAKSCMDHFGRRKLRTYQKLICLSPFTPASVNKDDPCHDILVGFIAVSTRYGKIRILALLLNSIHGWKVEKVLGWSLWLCGGSP